MESGLLADSARTAVKDLKHDPVSISGFSAQREVGGTEKSAEYRKVKTFTIL